MKKIALLLLVFTLFAGTSVYAQKLKNGTYDESVLSHGYGYVSVRVSVSGREIKDISVRASDDQDIWLNSLINGNHPRYPDGMSLNERKDFEVNSALLKKEGPRYTSAQDFANAIVKNQSTVIDVMSGATVTCEAVIDAVHNAIRGKNSDIFRTWAQEGYQKRLATAQRREKLKEEERQRVVKAEAEKKRQEEDAKKRAEEAEAERQRLEEEARQQRIAEALKQTPVTPPISEFKYDLADGTYGGIKIIKYLGTGMCIKIPEKIEGLSVTEIATGAFDKNTLVKIVIPGTIKNMMSFNGFTMLSEVTLGDGMTEIPGTIYHEGGERVSEVYIGVFEGCKNLNKVTLGKSIKVIPNSCFAGCTNLSEVVIPNSVTSIANSAFYGSGLTSIVIPDSVISIGGAAFAFCNKLESIKLPSNLKIIEHNIFNSSGLTSIVIPDSVEGIKWYAFSECKSLKSVKLPVSLERIHHATFYSCSSLSEILIPDTLKNVSFTNSNSSRYEDTFEGCTSLTLATKSKLRELGYTGDF